MKLVFTKLETPATEIKVAFDGVNYKSYNVDEIKTNGCISFTEEECPDLTKVKIQGKFSTLGSVEVNKAIELERGEGGESYPAELRKTQTSHSDNIACVSGSKKIKSVHWQTYPGPGPQINYEEPYTRLVIYSGSYVTGAIITYEDDSTETVTS